MIDFHIHSNTSVDSKMTIREIYDEAVRKKLNKICITNHHEPSEVRKKEYSYSLTEEKIAQIISEITALKKDGRCEIFFGVEMSYTKDEEGYIKEFLSQHEFDFVLGSIHYIQGWEFGNWSNREKMKNLDHEALREEYFKNLKTAIRTRLFDVMSHPDIYKRVLDEPEFSKVREHWEEVADLLVKNSVGFEINTSQSKMIPGETYPSRKIIECLVKNGVKIITTSSDAHRVEDIGRNIAAAETLLKNLSVKNIYSFEKRQPKQIML